VKRLMLVLVPVFLLGSNLCAQGPDWTAYPGAKAILDDMALSASKDIELKDAMENNYKLYNNEENVHELIMLSLLDDLPLAEATNYLAKAKRIMDNFGSEWLFVDLNLRREALEANELLEERPIKHLKERLKSFFIIPEEFDQRPADGMMMPVISEALLYFGSKENLGPDDIKTIIGTAKDEYKNGLLHIAYEKEQHYDDLPGLWHPYRYDPKAFKASLFSLELRVLCTSTFMAQALGIIELSTAYSKTLGKALTNYVTAKDFNSENIALAKIVKDGDLAKGLENFNKITELMTVTNVIEK